MKSTSYCIIEGVLYAIIGIGTPLVTFFSSAQEMSTRAIIAVSISSLVAGANAIKAFLSQSMSDKKPTP